MVVSEKERNTKKRMWSFFMPAYGGKEIKKINKNVFLVCVLSGKEKFKKFIYEKEKKVVVCFTVWKRSVKDRNKNKSVVLFHRVHTERERKHEIWRKE